MYEQYTDKQIVEMIVPKLMKVDLGWNWDVLIKYPKRYKNMIKAIATIYRSAYIRGQLGRSFIIGEKNKQNGRWVPANKDNIKVGSKVKMINGKGHRSKPWSFPDVGTVGTVMEVGSHIHLVQWPKGSTSRMDEWYCDDAFLEVLLCE